MTSFMRAGLSRRAALRGGLGFAAGMASMTLTGCGSTEPNPAAAPKVKPVPDGDITWFTWDGYVAPEVVAGFEKKYGVKVTQTFFDSDDAMLQKLATGLPYDLVTNNSAYLARSIAGGLVRPFDYADLKNIDQLVPFFKNAPYDKGAERYSVPYGLSSTGYLVRKDKAETTRSWSDLWNSTAAKGHITVLPQMEETIGMSLLRNGKDLNSADEAEVTAAVDELIALKPALLNVSSDTENDVAGGNAWIAHTWPGTAYRIIKASKTPEVFDFVQPKEGVPFGGDLLTIGAKAKAPGTAMLFIDWVLEAENAARNVTATGYPNGTLSGDAQYAELVKDYPFLDMGTETYEQARWKDSPTGARLQMYTQQWNRFKA
ncbi:hypothetical protein ADL00_26710 [Streptomyces sp. AS58]|uniref:Spermidine/putrescine ABC transporter substrate-binding protein n=1 Tax=Streptomyces cadmiisoli TaxID=2184053 RepID=A0A2Z4JEJ1_9ACTN|nr:MULTISPECIES: spermidine/putrescine ABC transporter substrate-binding protein [Streptomyces]AWW43486.1 spermidine/putrescine ABC transporter substrate-binding protein [Streptomyces cadmiisoli]KOV57638.1 hypothetical protein ADL00_26710 [Streptomyces sp. AS58]